MDTYTDDGEEEEDKKLLAPHSSPQEEQEREYGWDPSYERQVRAEYAGEEDGGVLEAEEGRLEVLLRCVHACLCEGGWMDGWLAGWLGWV